MTMTRTSESTAVTMATPPILLLAFELGQRTWKLGFSRGIGERPWTRTIAAGAVEAVATEIAAAKRRWQLPADTPVTSCYEAGRDGFWLHRWLIAQGIANVVVDSASIEVSQRAKRMKTDRLDLAGLLNLLARYEGGDRRVWRVVRVPTAAQEDARHWHRERETLQRDRTRIINRIKSLLATLGVRCAVSGRFLDTVAHARLWDGQPIPAGAQARLAQQWGLLQSVAQTLATHEARGTQDLDGTAAQIMTKLERVRAIGVMGARVLSTELFAWRGLRHAREIGALVGLVPARYQSGETAHDLGITRAGNVHVRRISVQLAWVWIQHQPDSALTQWYRRRFGGGSARLRRVGIVALARKLLVALWRYVDRDELPDGARMKPLVG
jgi:transposase